MLETYLPFILEMQEVAYLNCSAFVWPSEPQNKLSQLPMPPRQLAVIKRKLIRATGKVQKPGDAVQDSSSRCVCYSQDMERCEFGFKSFIPPVLTSFTSSQAVTHQELPWVASSPTFAFSHLLSDIHPVLCKMPCSYYQAHQSAPQGGVTKPANDDFHLQLEGSCFSDTQWETRLSSLSPKLHLLKKNPYIYIHTKQKSPCIWCIPSTIYQITLI